MAKLSAHGEKLTEISYSTYKLAFMSDGQILRNDGGGWKKYKKWKNGINVQDTVNKMLELREERKKNEPAYFAYVDALHNFCGFKDWSMVHEILGLLANDPDGAWAEINDNVLYCSFEEVATLCELFEAKENERVAKLIV